MSKRVFNKDWVLSPKRDMRISTPNTKTSRPSLFSFGMIDGNITIIVCLIGKIEHHLFAGNACFDDVFEGAKKRCSAILGESQEIARVWHWSENQELLRFIDMVGPPNRFGEKMKPLPADGLPGVAMLFARQLFNPRVDKVPLGARKIFLPRKRGRQVKIVNRHERSIT